MVRAGKIPSYAAQMPFVIGIAIAAIVGVLGRVSRMDRDKAFYAVVLIVVGHYYMLFGVMDGTRGSVVLQEALIFVLFAALAIIGFRVSMWFVVAGLALHGAFDLVRHLFLPGEGIPAFWPDFCLGFDIAAAAFVAATLMIPRSRREEGAP